MSKKLSSIIIAILILIIGYYLYQSSSFQKILSGKTSSSTPIYVATSSMAIYKPFEFNDFFKGETSPRQGFVDPVNHFTIYFKFDDSSPQAPNLTYDVLVNKDKVGEIAGQGLISYGFSSDGRYFAFRISSTCGAGCQHLVLRVIDVENRAILFLKPPRDEKFIQNRDNFWDIFPFIESVVWNNDKLKITFFLTGNKKSDGKFYRITPKEVWQYDPVTRGYAFIKTLPEANE
jgi:hypothetical protein